MGPGIKDPQPGASVERSILWPFVYAPPTWILLIHLGTCFIWFPEYKQIGRSRPGVSR